MSRQDDLGFSEFDKTPAKENPLIGSDDLDKASGAAEKYQRDSLQGSLAKDTKEPTVVAIVTKLTSEIVERLRQKYPKASTKAKDEFVSPIMALEAMLEDGDTSLVVYHGKVDWAAKTRAMLHPEANPTNPRITLLKQARSILSAQGKSLVRNDQNIHTVSNLTVLGSILEQEFPIPKEAKV